MFVRYHSHENAALMEFSFVITWYMPLHCRPLINSYASGNFSRVQHVILPYTDNEPESLPAITKNIKGCDGIIWNTKHRLTKEILDLCGR